jgi:hypothetical protein
LAPNPDSPGPSEDEDEPGNNQSLDADEPRFESEDEESTIHAEILVAEQLTADFQVHATRAGVLFSGPFL